MDQKEEKKEEKELSWAWYALDGREHPHYFHSEAYLASFPSGTVVADVGSGNGWALQALRDRGCAGIAMEIDDWSLGEGRKTLRPMVKARAEALPVRTESVNGAIFGGVLPFTDEDVAFGELARILRPGGRMEAYYLGIGFAVRDLVLGVNLRKRYFGLRSLVNTILIETIGRKLPGRFGDTVYISHRRLTRLYARHGFILRRHTPSPTFFGMTVFIYHSLERAGASSGATAGSRPALSSLTS